MAQIVSVSARVTVSLEIAVPSTWGPECKMSQIYDQAKVDALGILRQIAHPHTIVGKPTVRAVYAKESD